MKFIERKKKLDYLLESIEKGRCFSYKETASKLNCSESTVKRMIGELKESGYPVMYDKSKKKFVKISEEVTL